MGFLGMVNVYKCRPSQLLGLTDTYTSYCFDEACAYIIRKIENKEEPNFSKFKQNKKKYNSFADLYKHILNE